MALVAMTPFRLARCRRLMHVHRDVPMDFADATLVAIAEEMRVEGDLHAGSPGIPDLPPLRASRLPDSPLSVSRP